MINSVINNLVLTYDILTKSKLAKNEEAKKLQYFNNCALLKICTYLVHSDVLTSELFFLSLTAVEMF